MSLIEVEIKNCIEQIWNLYDTQSKGYLNKSEAKPLIMEILFDMGHEQELKESDFESFFSIFDKEG